MRGATVLAAGVLVATGLALAANTATAATVNFAFRCSAQPIPNQCPKTTPSKGKLNLSTFPGLEAGTRRIQYLFDDDFRFRPWVAPKCDPSQLAFADMAEAMSRCGSSLIGTGTASFFDPSGGRPVPACVLLFNGTNGAATGKPRIVFYFRLAFGASIPTPTCANPASNHEGDTTRFARALLGTPNRGDYWGTRIDLPFRITGIPTHSLEFNLQKDTATNGYVKARCFDPDRVWNVTTFITYNDSTTQKVSSRRTCKVG